jgi:hypothetical protein
MRPPGKGVGDRRMLRNFRLLTRTVSDHSSQFCAHPVQICRFGQAAQSSNCRILGSGVSFRLSAKNGKALGCLSIQEVAYG